MSKDKHIGIVYVLSNRVMPGLVKIDMTTRPELDARLKELYTTGVPVPFDVEYACEVNASDCSRIEKALHTAFDPQRINVNREFFQIKKEQAIAILELFNQKDVTNEVSDEMNNELDAADIASLQKATKHRPPLNFSQMGIPVGSILTYDADPKITVTVIGEKRVEYMGDEMSLTAVTTKLLNSKYAVQPTPRWSFNGENLSVIYDATYPIED
ncbi:MAG: GIY-YIG nuclease family protein [Muribaculum sp.]|nr:GIY-YIG nuclease family protein [Muribaculum sp.]